MLKNSKFKNNINKKTPPKLVMSVKTSLVLFSIKSIESTIKEYITKTKKKAVFSMIEVILIISYLISLSLKFVYEKR